MRCGLPWPSLSSPLSGRDAPSIGQAWTHVDHDIWTSTGALLKRDGLHGNVTRPGRPTSYVIRARYLGGFHCAPTPSKKAEMRGSRVIRKTSKRHDEEAQKRSSRDKAQQDHARHPATHGSPRAIDVIPGAGPGPFSMVRGV